MLSKLLFNKPIFRTIASIKNFSLFYKISNTQLIKKIDWKKNLFSTKTSTDNNSKEESKTEGDQVDQDDENPSKLPLLLKWVKRLAYLLVFSSLPYVLYDGSLILAIPPLLDAYQYDESNPFLNILRSFAHHEWVLLYLTLVTPRNQLIVLDNFNAILQMLESSDPLQVKIGATFLFLICDGEESRELILRNYPKLIPKMFQLANNPDRETSVGTLMALSALVLSKDNKLILHEHGILSELRNLFTEAHKKQEPEKLNFVSMIMAGWFYGWPADKKPLLSANDHDMISQSIQLIAETFLNNGLPEASIIAFKEVLKMAPTNAFNHMLLGRAYAGSKQYKEAIETLEIATSQLLEMADKIGNPQIHSLAVDCKLYRAALMAKHAENDVLKSEGVEILLEFFEDDANSIKPQALSEYALITVESLISMSKFDDAIKTAKSILKNLKVLNPSLMNKLNMLMAQSQLQTGKTNECLLTMEKHIKDLTFDSSAHYLIALAYFIKKDYKNSRDYAKAASKLSPEFAEPHFLLAKIAKLEDDFKEFNIYSSLKPDSPEGFFHAGVVSVSLEEDPLNSFSKALDLFEAELKFSEDSSNHKGRILNPVVIISDLLKCDPDTKNALCVKASKLKQLLSNNNNQQKML